MRKSPKPGGGGGGGGGGPSLGDRIVFFAPSEDDLELFEFSSQRSFFPPLGVFITKNDSPRRAAFSPALQLSLSVSSPRGMLLIGPTPKRRRRE